MKRIAIACAAVLGLMLAGSPAADAGGVRLYIGGYGGYGGHGGYGHWGGNRYRSPRIWHDTSHYDWHPGQWVPHGNHFHYLPGHWDYHRTGHWDTWHGDHVHHHGH